MFSAAFPYACLDGNDAVFVVTSQQVVKKASGEVDIGRGASFGEGEEGEQPLSELDTIVNNVVESYGLQEVTFGTKKEMLDWAKPYLGRAKGHLEASNSPRLAPFMAGATRFLQSVVQSFDDWSFFANANMDMEGMIVFARWEGENPAPNFHFLRDGLVLFFPGTGRSLTAGACVPADIAARGGVPN